MELHKIVREGNIRLARAGLTHDYLGIDPVDDPALIQLVLTRLESLGPWITAEDYDAWQLLEILIDSLPFIDPLHAEFTSRLEGLRARFRSPLPNQRLNLPTLKVTLNDPRQS